MTSHVVEVFTTDQDGHGWQCFGRYCQAEAWGYATRGRAQDAADDHEATA